MSERFSKTGLSSGSSWNLFAENTAFEESGKFWAFILFIVTTGVYN